MPWPIEIVKHVREVVSEIEGRWFSIPEILALLKRIVRRRSLVQRSKHDKVVAWLNEYPP